MLITKDKLNLAKYAKKDSCLPLGNLCLDDNKAMVSDGKILIQIQDNPPLDQDFPNVGILEDYTPGKDLVSPATASKVLKNFTKNSLMPIIENVLVGTKSTEKQVKKQDTISFGLTDLDSSIVIKQRKIDGDYPDIDQVIPKKPPKATTDIDIKYLAKVVKALGEFSKGEYQGRIKIDIHGNEGIMVFTCEKHTNSGKATMTALIMPLKKEE